MAHLFLFALKLEPCEANKQWHLIAQVTGETVVLRGCPPAAFHAQYTADHWSSDCTALMPANAVNIRMSTTSITQIVAVTQPSNTDIINQ